MSLFDPAELDRHLGPDLDLTPHQNRYKKLEAALIEKCKRFGLDCSADVIAHENPYFDTFGYTLFAGMFLMHPLNFHSSLRHTADALADNVEIKDYVGTIAERILKTKQGKYRKRCFKEQTFKKINALAVMPGDNKLDTVCTLKLLELAKRDPYFIVKPHPLTNKKALKWYTDNLPSKQIASNFSDLYDLINKTDVLYTTHMSESVMTGVALGKKIEPLDKLGSALSHGFSHVNYFLFTTPQPAAMANKIISSPKSGIIDIDVDTDWETKMDEYLEYAMSLRELDKGRYLYGRTQIEQLR